jgi:hypothetical protein
MDTCTETASRSCLGPHPGTWLHPSHHRSYIRSCHLPNFRGWLLGDLNSDGISLPSPILLPSRIRISSDMGTVEFAVAPKRCPERYKSRAIYRQKQAFHLVEYYFKHALARAQQRHDRYVKVPLAFDSWRC